MPIIEENFYFDKLFKNETLLVLEEPIYYQEMSENSKSSSVERRDEESFELNLDYRIIGYIYDEHINVGMKRIYEIDVKKELKEILFDQNGRPRIKRFEIDLFNLYDYLNLIKKEDFINSDHQTNILVTKTDFFLIKYYSIGPKTTEILYKFCRFLNHTINCLDSITQELNGEVKFLVFRIQDFLEFNKIDRTDKIIDLIQIETGNKIHFKRKHFTIFENTLKVNKEYSQSISYMVEDLFGCYGKFKNANDVKGIYYDPKSHDFYIIIKRFFVQIKEDIFIKGFKLNDAIYENGISLKFSNNPIKFEIDRTKWVKTIRSTMNNYSFMITYPGYVFKLNVDAFKINNFKKEIGLNLIDKCPDQILTIDEKVFCFEEKFYYYLIKFDKLTDELHYKPSDKFKISNIFTNSLISYNKDQILKFIFNHQTNYFVFMTLTHLFVFDYANFLTNSKNQIYTNYSDDESVTIIRNHFFDHLFSEQQYLSTISDTIILILIYLLTFIIIFTLLQNDKFKRFFKKQNGNLTSSIKSSEIVNSSFSSIQFKISKSSKVLVKSNPIKSSASMGSIQDKIKIKIQDKLKNLNKLTN